MSLIRSLSGRFSASALLALTATSLALAQDPITVFEDTFAAGSTVNSSPASPAVPTRNATAYQVISNLDYPVGTPTLDAATSEQLGKLRVALDSTKSGRNNVLVQALFNPFPVKLTNDGDWIELTVTFTAETALLVDSLNTSGANSNALYLGLYGSSGSATNNIIVRDEIGYADSTKDTPLTAYVHEPNPPIAGGKIDASSDMKLVFPKYWKGYTGRILRTPGRHQVWYQNNATLTQTTGLQPTQNSTLASLEAGKQYTAVLQLTRVNYVDGDGVTSARISVAEKLFEGASTDGNPTVDWKTSSAQGGSNNMGVVYDALAFGLRVNANSTNGTTETMAVNSVKVVTTGHVIIAPSIITQPETKSVEINTPASLSVVATGGNGDGTALTYQWFKNGIEIAGATSSTYDLYTGELGAETYSVVVTSAAGSTTSANAIVTVTVPAAPIITTHPASQTVLSGDPATFTVAAIGSGLNYQWEKSIDSGATFTPIVGATSASYTIANTATSSIAHYRAIVSNSTAAVPSDVASLDLTYSFTEITPSGYAASATGGGSASPITVTDPVTFKTQAESNEAAVITVRGTVNLNGKVSVKSNKTIQGIDGEATLIGNLELASGVSNVLLRGLNITNPAGSGVTISGASNVYINHISFYDCSDIMLSIVNGADNISVTWSEFYYTASATGNRATLVGNPTGETKPIRVTFNNNWWSDNTVSHMPETSYGRVHMYNNLFKRSTNASLENTTSTLVRSDAELFSEFNQYTQVTVPLAKETNTNALIRTLANTYTSSSGAYAGGDFITFAPPYPYQLKTTNTVTADVSSGAGNLAGASSITPTPVGVVSINGPTAAVPLGGSFTLTADTTGLTLAATNPYMWRRNGQAITGATTESITRSGIGFTEAGHYTVAVFLASGEILVSAPFTVTMTSGSSLVPSSESEGDDGGGGAPSTWFIGALALLATLRGFFRRST